MSLQSRSNKKVNPFSHVSEVWHDLRFDDTAFQAVYVPHDPDPMSEFRFFVFFLKRLGGTGIFNLRK